MQSALPSALSDSPLSGEKPEAGNDRLATHSALVESGSSPAISGSPAYEFTKRGIDLVLGTVGLAFTGLVSIIVVPLIIRSSDGPAIFRQTRVGKGGKPFTCFKFRTMALDAEARKPEIAHLNEVAGPAFKIADDPRGVEKLRWLRKFSIDEMPQFWNVVRGDMSLVGPRPPEPGEVADYNARQLGRLAVKPGMTCTWQVNGRNGVGFDEWVEMDLAYIQNRNTRLDLKLIVKTIPAVLSGKGAS
jgi:lipopolysaccharide/colanic/teichoic acid biosynthesis glycosyltransferase